MDYKCSFCGETVYDDLKKFMDHTDAHVIDLIKAKHPEWVEKNGICKKCYDYYHKQLRGEDL